jgi:hypothetical protein
MNHNLASRNLRDTIGCELVIELINIQVRKMPTENKMGSRQRFLGMNGRCSWMAESQIIKPKSKGSLGINSPKLELNSSMLMDRGVRKAMAINNFSV